MAINMVMVQYTYVHIFINYILFSVRAPEHICSRNQNHIDLEFSIIIITFILNIEPGSIYILPETAWAKLELKFG